MRRRAALTAPRAGAGGRPAGRVAALALAATALVVSTSSGALAHEVLEASAPADGAVLDAAPDEVGLTFGAAPLEVGAVVEVTGPDDGDWSEGAPTVDGTALVQPLRAGLPAGDYAIAWRAVSGDGHPVTGRLAFTVRTPPGEDPSPPPSPEVPADPTSTPTAGRGTTAPAADDAASGGVPAWLPAVVVGLLAVPAGVALVTRRSRR